MIVSIALSGRIVGYVVLLSFEVLFVTDAVFVLPRVPDFSRVLVSGRKGIANFDELNNAGSALVCGGCEENANVVRQDDIGVQEEFACFSITEECGYEELGVGISLEMSLALEGVDGDGVRVLFLA